jgi:alkylation response protein AidB-like acyl-CoA dehydrogenase
MYIGWQPHHAAWQQSVHDYCEKTARPRFATQNLDRAPTAQEWEEIMDDLLGRGVIDSYPVLEDGSPDHIAMAILLEELARVNHALTFHTFQRLHVPRIFGEMLDPEQAQVYKEVFFSQRSIVAGGFSEPEAGSDVRAARTTARPGDGDTWVINGRKIWVSGASHADAVVVYTRIDKEIEPSGFGLFIVPPGAGYRATPIPTIGMRGHDLCEVEFDHVVVPGIARIRGNVDAAVLGTIGVARAFQGAVATGFAQEALDIAVQYAKTHHQFGRPIGEFQLIQKLLAEMATGVATSRLITLQALNTLMTQGESASRTEASMAKMYATETAWRVASKGMEVFGSLGLTVECGLERLFRDARMLLCPDGTTQIHELLIGRSLTGLSAMTR